MIRFVAYALPLLLLLMAVFGFAVDVLDLEPRSGSLIRLAFFEQPRVPATVVLGAWLMESCGLLALFLLAQGRCGAWWLDGLVAGWLGWVFRGPLLVVTIVVASRQPQEPWWQVAFAWWILYSICGFALALLSRRSGLRPPVAVADPEVGRPTPELDGTAADSEAVEVEAGAPDPAQPGSEARESDDEAESEVEVEPTGTEPEMERAEPSTTDGPAERGNA